MLWPVAPSGMAHPSMTSSTSRRLQPRALHGVLDHVTRQGGAVGVVERTAVGLADGSPGRRDDHRVRHGRSSWPLVRRTGRAGPGPPAPGVPVHPTTGPRGRSATRGGTGVVPTGPLGVPPGRQYNPGRASRRERDAVQVLAAIGRCDERARPPHHGRLPADEGVRRGPADPDRGPGHPRDRRGRPPLHRRAVAVPSASTSATATSASPRLPPADRAAGPGSPDARDQRPGARAGEAPARVHAAPVHDGQAPVRRLGGDRGGDEDGPPVPQAERARRPSTRSCRTTARTTAGPATPSRPAAGRAGSAPYEPLAGGFIHLHTPDPYRPPFPGGARDARRRLYATGPRGGRSSSRGPRASPASSPSRS